MSVRRQRSRDALTGKETEYWIVDLTVRYPDGRRERVRKVPQIQTRRGAQQYERQLLAELLSDRPPAKEVPPPKEEKPRRPTVASFAKDFVEKYAEANNKPSEVASKRMICDLHLVPALGSLRLDEVGPAQIEGYKAGKLKELSAKTVNNHLIVLRRMLGVAVEWGLLERVPIVRWLKVPEAEFDFLTFDEADRLVAATEEDGWRTMIVVGLKAGLRQGELLALRWSDVDLVAGRLVVRRSVWRGILGPPKGGRSREVALSPEAVRSLKAHRHLRGELVFCTDGGRMFTKNECKHPLWRACKRAGLRRIGWHVLRHTFASHLVMRGAPLKAVQELLGHATIEMTMRYAHLSPDTRRDAVALLDLGAPHEAMGRQKKGTVP
jgi:integrase